MIVATGSQWRRLGVPGEDRLLAHGVSACATCDGFFFRDQDIAVVGGGDSAMEEATFLTRFARSVTIVHRRDALRASAIMQERAFTNEKIKFVWNAEIDEVLGETSMTGLRVRDVDDRRGHGPRRDRPVRRDRPRPALRPVRGPARPGRRGLHHRRVAEHAHQRARRVRRAATSSTTPTARRSPPPAPAVRLPSTPSATSPTRKTAPTRRPEAPADTAATGERDRRDPRVEPADPDRSPIRTARPIAHPGIQQIRRNPNGQHQARDG